MTEDVYETSDLPESDQNRTQEESFESEHIEKINLNVSSAYDVFKGKHLDSAGVDFSDSAYWRRGYGSGRFVVELASQNTSEPETPLQQFNRLQNEILLLGEKVRDVQKKAESDATAERAAGDLTANDVTRLQQQLKQLQIEQIIGQQASVKLTDPHAVLAKTVEEALSKVKPPKDPSGGKGKSAAGDSAGDHVIYELFAHPDKSQHAQRSKTVELDARLAKLEQALGNDPNKFASLASASQGGKSIVDIVDTLEQRVKLLDPNQLELIEGRLVLLAQKLQQFSEKKPAVDAEQSAKVNELYDLVKRWDGYCCNLPQLLQRLQALKDIHEQALQFTQSLAHLDGVQQEIAKTLDSDAALLNEVKSNLQHNLDTIRTNCESIEKRLKAVGK